MRTSKNHMRLVAAILAGAVVAGGTFALIHGRSENGTAAARGTGQESQSQVTAEVPRATRQQRLAVEAAVARLHAMRPVAARTSSQHPAIGTQPRAQPDLYAAAFTKQVLTQDYRSNRDALLAWVQSESARSTEPTVVGLTPTGLRDRLAVASLVDATDGPAAIPSPQAWAALGRRHGFTTVTVQRVITPPTWTSAVAAGKVVDPGVTAREVDAELTLHTNDAGKAQTRTYSVALVMNMEGPPTRDDYGFITAVTYRAVEGGN